MIKAMEYIAFVSGVLMGILFLGRKKNFELIIAYFVFYKYRNRDRFYKLFDHLKKDVVMEYIEDNGLAYNYSDYLHIHKEIRPTAYEKAMYYYSTTASMVILRILPICLLPAIIFLSNWYLYVAGVLFIAILTTIYRFVVKPEKIALSRDLFVIIVISDYIKEKREKEASED